MLPTSRNTTYSTESPIYPNDLNDMQDHIIRAETIRKATIPIPIPAAEFMPTSYASGLSLASGTNWTGGVGDAVAPLGLVAGFKLGTVTWSTNRAGVGSQLMYLTRRPFGGGAGANVGSVIAITSGTGFVETAVTYNHVIEAGYFYSLVYGAGHTSHEMIGARFTVSDDRSF